MTTTVSRDPPTGNATPRYSSASETQVATGGFSTSALVGAGIAILALIALGGLAPRVFSAIAVIAVGAMLIAEALGVGAQYRRSVHTSAALAVMGGGALIVELIGAAGAIVLGILALLNIAAPVLLDIATIGYGAALMLATGAVLRFGRSASYEVENAVSAYASTRPVAGMGALLLGIIGLLHLGQPHQMLFVGVAVLAVGAATFMSGIAFAGSHSRELTTTGVH